MSTFKSYSERSKARRALVQVYKVPEEHIDSILKKVDGKHGFYLSADNVPCNMTPAEETAAAEFLAPHNPPANTATQDYPPALDELQAAQDAHPGVVQTDGDEAENGVEDEEEAPAPAASAFGAFALSQLVGNGEPAPGAVTPEQVQQRTSQRTEGLKIEKNRAQQNGVKERSKGGLCHAVWSALDELAIKDPATGVATVPTVAQIKELAVAKGWNVNNASIEYYQWRKFHGITGRGKKTI